MRAVLFVVVLLSGCAGPSPETRSEHGGDAELVRLPVISSVILRDPQGFLHVLGEAQNKEDVVVGYAFVHVRVFSESGALLAERAVPPPRLFVPPGGRSPFDVFLDVPGRVGRHEVDVTAERVPGARPDDLKVLRSSLRKDAGTWTIEGTLRNEGFRPAPGVEVVVTLYAPSGEVAGVGTGNAEGRDLRPGESSPFRVRMPASGMNVVSHNATAQPR